MAPGNNTTHHQRGGGGAGQGGGRGGRFNHQSNSGSGGGKPASKPTEKKYTFAPHTNGGKQTNYASYHSTVEHICQHIQAKFTSGHDCAESPRESKKIDLSQEEPERTMSTNPDEKVRYVTQAGYDIKYTAEITTHATRVQTLEDTFVFLEENNTVETYGKFCTRKASENRCIIFYHSSDTE